MKNIYKKENSDNPSLLFNIGISLLFAFIIFLAVSFIYIFIDRTLIYEEIKNSIIPRQPYDTINHIEQLGKTSDGWYLANIFVVDTETNDFANNLIRYNPDTKKVVIPSEQFGFESCIMIKNER